MKSVLVFLRMLTLSQGGKEGPFLTAVRFFVLVLPPQTCLRLYVPTYELQTE